MPGRAEPANIRSGPRSHPARRSPAPARLWTAVAGAMPDRSMPARSMPGRAVPGGRGRRRARAASRRPRVLRRVPRGRLPRPDAAPFQSAESGSDRLDDGIIRKRLWSVPRLVERRDDGPMEVSAACPFARHLPSRPFGLPPRAGSPALGARAGLAPGHQADYIGRIPAEPPCLRNNSQLHPDARVHGHPPGRQLLRSPLGLSKNCKCLNCVVFSARIR